MSKIRGEYVATKEIIKIVKLALVERWGRENVSVKQGRGTASSWVEASIEIPKPHDCHCQLMQPYCDRCREALSGASDEGKKRVYACMQSMRAEFSSYYGDMDTEPSDCFILQASIKRQ